MRRHFINLVAIGSTLALLAAACAGGGSGPSEGVVADGNFDGACVPISNEEESVPRLWIEATLDAIRADFPAPTVHARNLWHLSAAMWDAYAAYTPTAQAYFTEVDVPEVVAPSPTAATTAMSYAAHRLLTHRYELATGGDRSLASFDALMVNLCLDPEQTPSPGSPAAVGLAIADAAIEFGLSDGALETERYIDPSYQPANPSLVVNSDAIEMDDPNRWQPLELPRRVTQNGQVEQGGVQVFIGSNWGSVTSFALPTPDAGGITLDPGPPPLLGGDSNQVFIDGVVQLIEYSDSLGGARGDELIDISPGAKGNIALGETSGPGRTVNPTTGEPYEPNEVPHGDYGRAIAEFWADGPDSETPPGHWNTLAIAATDQMASDHLRWGGSGQVLSRQEWDLRLFFTLNASLHDSAVAVWGAKRAYDYARPISMVRYLGVGNEGGLPDVPGLIETVTEQSAADGQPHQGLPVGETVVRSWMGPVGHDWQRVGVGWRPAIDWIPYQRPTFVSPAFAAYVSGHSGFSRAAADILTMATGTEYFPGGLFTHLVPVDSLIHEEGPSVDVELQWATYQDAADEAGESRRYGGIHVEADDIAGRILGAEIAELTWLHFQR